MSVLLSFLAVVDVDQIAVDVAVAADVVFVVRIEWMINTRSSSSSGWRSSV